jgi:hypothetical protein
MQKKEEVDDLFETLPEELCSAIFKYVVWSRQISPSPSTPFPSPTSFPTRIVPSLKDFTIVSLVCKQWHEIANSNAFWKDLTLMTWFSLKSGVKIKDWKAYFRKRYKTFQLLPLETHPIENCSFELTYSKQKKESERRGGSRRRRRTY